MTSNMVPGNGASDRGAPERPVSRTIAATFAVGALLVAAVLSFVAPSAATVSGTPALIGTWTNPAIAGIELDPLTGYFHLINNGTGQIDVSDASGVIVDSYGAVELSAPVFASITATRVYVADLNDTVDYFDRDTGAHLGGWGSAGSGIGQFTDPWGIEVDGSSVYVSDSGNSRVQVFTLGGAWQQMITGAGSGHELMSPRGAIIFGGELYVVDSSLDEVVVFNPSTGAYIRHWVLGAATNARGVDITVAGDVFVTDLATDSTYVYTTTGTLQTSFATGNGPEDIAVDPLGMSLWVSDFASSQWHSFSFATCSGLVPTMVGTSFDDTFDATALGDIVYLDEGDDTVSLLGGADLACGGPGNDTIRGDAGNDTLFGDGGADDLRGDDDNDLLIGGADGDNLRGGSGDDDLRGEAGDDVIFGDGGADIITGAAGNDTIFGGAGIDTISGDSGNDTINGDGSADTITGGPGDDDLNGGAQNDIIYGSIGNDILRGGDGVDRLYGQDGDDEMYGDDGDDRIYGGAGNDVMRGGNGLDRLWGQGDVDEIFGEAANDIIFGGIGNDTISGGPGDDTIHAQGGDDTIDGDDGHDTLYGHVGNDTIRGGIGDDSMFGHGGADTMLGGSGLDSIFGGAGNDVLQGGGSNDSLSGQGGDDTMFGDAGNNDSCAGGTGTDTADPSCETITGVP